jgi:hypothetical protein
VIDVAASQLRGHMLCCGRVADLPMLLLCAGSCMQEHQSSTGQEDCIDKETFFKSLGAGQLQRDMPKGWGGLGDCVCCTAAVVYTGCGGAN